MMHMPPWKIYTIIAVCVLGAIFSAPNLLSKQTAESIPGWLPHRQISLGLDLQGGSHLLLEVDTATVARERLDSLAEGVRAAMRTQRIVVTDLRSDGTSTVSFKVRDASQLEAARNAVKDLDTTVTVSATPDGTVTMRLDPQKFADTARQ